MAKPELEVKKAQYLKVPFTHLALIEGLNLREDYGNIKELAESIKANGVQQPIRCTFENDWYYVVDGHRRFKAAQLLYDEGIKDLYLPVMIQPKGTSEEQTVVEMFIGNDGKPLTQLEQATGVERLVFYGWDTTAIAAKLAKSRTHVENLLLLAKAPLKFKKLIKKGIISATYGIDLLKQGEDAVNAFLGTIETAQAEDESESEESTGPKTKTAKITKKKVSINSFSELKTFAREAKITEFPKGTEKFYWLLQDLAANKLQSIDFKNFFTDGNYEQKAETPAKIVKAAKPKKAPKAAKEPKPVKVTKAAKPTKAKKGTQREILYKGDPK